MLTVRKSANEGAALPEKVAQVVHIQEKRVTAVLAVYPRDAAVVCLCHDCGLEKRETVGSMIRDHQYGGLTPAELGERLRCERSSCGGSVDVTIGANV